MQDVDLFSMRIFTRKSAGVVVGILVVATVFLVGYRWRVGKAWQEMLDTGVELEYSIASNDGRRGVLYGEALEGKAQQQYARAIELLSESFFDDWLQYDTARENEDEEAGGMRNAIVNANLEALAAMSIGAHMLDAGFDLDWNDPEGLRAPSMMRSRNLVNLSLMAAGKFLEDGEHERAVDALLDGLQTACDHMRSPVLIGQMIGCALLNIASTGALIDQGLLNRIPAHQLQRLDRGLDQISLELPVMDAVFETEMAWFIRNTAVVVDPKFSLPDWGESNAWSVGFRYWFSARLMCAEYVREAMAWHASSTGEDERSWNDWNADFDEQQSRMAEHGTPLWGVIGFKQRSVEVSRRHCLTRFNMARLAVAYRLTGSTHDLPDHFGDQLLVSIEDDQLLIESVGPGGVSDIRESFGVQIGT